MERSCRSSWIGAHESFQAREYDAGASLTSSEPVRKTKDSWVDPAKFLKFSLEVDVPNINEII
jgi:hypothetical protein